MHALAQVNTKAGCLFVHYGGVTGYHYRYLDISNPSNHQWETIKISLIPSSIPPVTRCTSSPGSVTLSSQPHQNPSSPPFPLHFPLPPHIVKCKHTKNYLRHSGNLFPLPPHTASPSAELLRKHDEKHKGPRMRREGNRRTLDCDLAAEPQE
ncbi:hypothetical protein BDQ17DRAFT_1379331 [Cyathus striatus]|nr:hypothetical protein BDQ17DRAFT_1379331 [Cyathus striatus]